MDVYDPYEFYEEPVHEPSEEEITEFVYKPDSYFLEVQREIRSLFENEKESIYFIRQLQVKFEKKYYHWITNNAAVGLYKLGYLKDIRIPKEKGTSTRFFMHRSNRYPMRKVKMMEKVIEEYSKDDITRSCGHRAEDLFVKALAMRGFMPMQSKVKDFKEKVWEKTGHDLDFIFTKDGIDYGCEIKNTLGYIEKEELEVKLEMCNYFGVKPLFIMRYSPKAYNEVIISQGGFALIFETQIYELSQLKLVERIKKVLDMPVICSKSIPEGIIDRFDRWHRKHVN